MLVSKSMVNINGIFKGFNESIMISKVPYTVHDSWKNYSQLYVRKITIHFFLLLI